MSGWTYEVERRKVKSRKTTVSAYSTDDAIELAKRRDKESWGEPETRHEYTAREIFD